MKIEEVDGLEEGRPIDEAIKPAVELLDKLPKRFRGILFVYDDEHDLATIGLFNYMDHAHTIKDADALARGVKEVPDA